MTKLTLIKNQITLCEQEFQRPPGAVKLIAVTKGRSIAELLELYAAGQRAFAESYLQEALEKIPAVADKEIEWHFIGPLQSNKTRKIAEHFSWVQSVDNLNIAKRLNEQRPSHLPPLNICIQVNISAEDTKSGVTADALLELAQQCHLLPHLRLRGLMTIPAPTSDFAAQRAAFKQCFLLWQTLSTQGFDLDTLSMGMSDDFVAAIAEGSTMIRLGRALY